MWPDNETERDFLNFAAVADTVAEIVDQAHGRPVSIGVSGAWGVGKSSLMRMVRHALQARANGDTPRFVFVEFNAWLYQGYDDARAALMEVIADKLAEEAARRRTGLDKAKELLRRVNWLRVARLSASSALALAFGIPPVGLVGEAYRMAQTAASGTIDAEDLAEVDEVIPKLAGEAAGLIKERPTSSPPKEIHAIRECFEDALAEMGMTLVVLIDDLDRCLPPTTIATLEAIRLFLFLKNTAFVIAADDQMIKHAVKHHFEGIEEKAVTSYFDKLIQVPIRVPPLGTQEVRAYMMLLFIEQSALSPGEQDDVRRAVCNQLSASWQGKRVDRAYMLTLRQDWPAALVARFDTTDRIAPLMTTASEIAGNPRLIKRFLNALSMRMAISRRHGVGVDEAALTKMLLFERCADSEAYASLTKAVSEDVEGKPRFLTEWEGKALAGEQVELRAPWNDNFVRDWLALLPPLADTDLRGILYVSREHLPLITPEDRLSSEAAELLEALLRQPDMAVGLRDRLARVPRPQTAIMMGRLLGQAQQVQEWGVPPILEACITLADADPTQGNRLAAFLIERPLAQIKAGIVPKIADRPWAHEVLRNWSSASVSTAVKRAIAAQEVNDGNKSI